MKRTLFSFIAFSLLSVSATADDLSAAGVQPQASGNAQVSAAPKPYAQNYDESAVYIIQLQAPAVAAYEGGIGDLEATSPKATGKKRLNAKSKASKAYEKYLADQQDAFIAHCEHAFGRDIAIPFKYKFAVNGIAMTLTGAEAAAIARQPNVISVERERMEMPMTDNGPALIGAPAVWKGRADDADHIGTMGEGVVVAILDSGINFDHPSFADIGGDGYDHENPLGSGNYVPGSYCDVVDPTFCNDKLIGAWAFVQGPSDPVSPDDSDGHGSHTASTVAGNVLPSAAVIAPTTSYAADISGVAPHANIIAYDVCIDTCPGSALLAAVDQVVIDSANLPNGIAALNYSISGGNNPYNDAIEIGFLNAVAAGIYVATSAGNSGPGPGTTGHNSPWVSATAATTHERALVANLVDMSSDNGPLANLAGASFSAGYGPAPIVHAADFPTANGSSNDTDPGQCLDPFPPGHFNGEIVVCDRGSIARVAKGANVLAGGAGGYVLANLAAQGEGTVADPHFLPAVHLGVTNGDTLRAWLAGNSGAMATITETVAEFSKDNADVVAGFSSRGPSGLDVMKPDIAAPGVNVMAAYSSHVGLAAPEITFLSGTSMASPHNAGSAALVSALRDWTPSEIKSALMMTAVKPSRMLKDDGVTTADPFDVGAGRINLRKVLNAGLVLDEEPIDYFLADPATGGDPSALNIASMTQDDCFENCSWTRTVTNKSDKKNKWELKVKDVGGIDFSVEPKKINLKPGESADITVTADATYASAGWQFGELKLKSKKTPNLHMPIAVLPATSTLPENFSKSVSHTDAVEGDVLSYEINVVNGRLLDPVAITDTLPEGMSFVPGSAMSVLVNGIELMPLTISGDTLSWEGQLDPGGLEVFETASPFGYFPMAAIGIAPVTPPANTDDGGLIFGGLPPMTFNGDVYDEVILSVNGTLELGTSSGLATGGAVPRLPSEAPPNNLLAPLWADLDMTAKGNMWVATVGAGPGFSFTVFEWGDMALFGDATASYSFQIWYWQEAEAFFYAYGGISSVDVPMTVGVENSDGTVGASYYHNSDGATPEGTAPAVGQDLTPVALVGGELSITFDAELDRCRGKDEGKVNRALLTSGDISAQAIASTSCEKQRKSDDDDDDDDDDDEDDD